ASAVVLGRFWNIRTPSGDLFHRTRLERKLRRGRFPASRSGRECAGQRRAVVACVLIAAIASGSLSQLWVAPPVPAAPPPSHRRSLAAGTRCAPNVEGRSVMHLPRFMRRVNRTFTNPVLGTIAWALPPLAIVGHVGRKSGRRYRNPVVAFPTATGFVIPMTY